MVRASLVTGLSGNTALVEKSGPRKTVGSVVTSPCITAMSSSLGHQTVVTGNTNKATMRIATLCCLIAGASAFGTSHHVFLVGRKDSGVRAAGGD